jgi:hypothetical protein
MTIVSYIVIGYFIIGILLAYKWWIEEHYCYSNEDEFDEIDSNAFFLIVLSVIFWPCKAVKKYFEMLIN